MKRTLCLLIFLLCSIRIAHTQSLCWEITGNGLKRPSYLYGTMHVSDKKVLQLSEQAWKAFYKSKMYAMEIDPDKMNIFQLVNEMMSSGEKSLKATLTKQDYRLLDSLFRAKMGVGVSAFDKMQPIIIQTILSTGGDKLDRDSSGLFLDMYLYKLAKKKKKNTTGIETINEQLKALTSLNYDDQIELLLRDLKNPDSSENDFSDMMRFYLSGSLDSLMIFSEEAKMPAKFAQVLIDERNIRMADRIEPLIRSKVCFIAIGALHLPGSKGVIELLRRRGYTVKPFL